jgi:hypothetical protein
MTKFLVKSETKPGLPNHDDLPEHTHELMEVGNKNVIKSDNASYKYCTSISTKVLQKFAN